MTQLSLLVGGQRFANWLSYECDSALDTPAAAWSFSVRLADAADLAIVTPGAWAEVHLDDEVILSGRIDDTRSQGDRRAHLFTARGRDQAALALDYSAPLTWTYTKTTMAALINAVTQTVGMTRTAVVDDSGSFSAKPEPGESCWEFLVRVAQRRSLRAWMAPDGTLHVGRWTTSGPSIATLTRVRGGPNNILSATVRRSLRKSASKITICGSWDSESDSYAVSGSYSDPEFPFTREAILSDGDVESNADAVTRARQEMAERKAEEFTVELRVRGHAAPAGTAWAPNQLVTLIDELEDINEQLLITGRRCILNRRDGTVTDLTLKRPAYYDV